MKKLIMTTVISIMMLSPMVAQANPVACKAYLCLAGSAQGAKGNYAACSDAVNQYMNLRVYTPPKGFNEVATAAERALFIASCGKVDPKHAATIGFTFGPLEYFTY